MKELVSARVLAALTQKMDADEWKPGEKLPSLSSLAKQYGVGISTMREAIRILENRGYVLIEHGRGIFMRSRSQWISEEPTHGRAKLPAGELFSLLEFRGLLEPDMAALAAQRGTPGQIQKIKFAAMQMVEEVSSGNNYYDADIAFHDYIADACSNQVMAQVMKGISDQLMESRHKTALVPGSPERAAHFHMLIALAIEQHNADLAREMMKAHMDDVMRDLTMLSKEDLKEKAGHLEK